MEAVVIECESCSNLSTLGQGFPDQSWGEVSQITCPRCGAAIEIDLTGSTPEIRSGRLIRTSRVQLQPASRQGSSSLSPHTIEAEPSSPSSVRSPLSNVPRASAPQNLDLLPDSEVLSAPSSADQGLDEEDLPPDSMEPPALSTDRLEVEESDLIPDSAVLSAPAGEVEELAGEVPGGARRKETRQEEARPEEARPTQVRPEQARQGVPSRQHPEAPHPPRPSELHARGAAPSGAEEEEARVGLSPLEPVQGSSIRLTQDGRLVNQTDEPGRRRLSFLPLGLVAAAGFGSYIVFSSVAPFTPDRTESAEEAGLALGSIEAPPEQELPEPEAESAVAGLAATGTDVEELDEMEGESPSKGSPTSRRRTVPTRSPAAAASSTEAQRVSGAPTDGGDRGQVDPGQTAEETDVLQDTVDGETSDALPPFSRDAAASALNQAKQSAAGCRSEDDPYGVAQVTVTFAPSGKVTSASVTGHPFAGTKVGGCIATKFRGARVPAYEGDFVTVTKAVAFQ